MPIGVSHKGSFRKAEKFLRSASREEYLQGLDILAQEGVTALASATPKDTGVTSESWGYEIRQEDGVYQIHWINSNVNRGINIALILQLGHGTRNGGYVQGLDYINPALKPIFDAISEKAWKVVRS